MEQQLLTKSSILQAEAIANRDRDHYTLVVRALLYREEPRLFSTIVARLAKVSHIKKALARYEKKQAALLSQPFPRLEIRNESRFTR